jgi:predicted phage tail protein
LSNFDSANSASGEPVPGTSGTAETMTIDGLAPNTPYYFAVRVADEVLNWSGLSNVPTITLQGESVIPPVDENAPAAVTTMIITNSSTGSVTLKWIEPLSAQTINAYEVRYSSREITDSNVISATKVANIPKPQLAGVTKTVTIKNLIPNKKYYFTVRAIGTQGASPVAKLVCSPRRLPLSLIPGQPAPNYCQPYTPYPKVSK